MAVVCLIQVEHKLVQAAATTDKLVVEAAEEVAEVVGHNQLLEQVAWVFVEPDRQEVDKMVVQAQDQQPQVVAQELVMAA